MKNQVAFINSMILVFMLYACQTQAIATSIDFFSDGIIQEPDIYENVGIWNEAVVDMTGGTVTNDLALRNQSTLNLSGGSVWSIFAFDSSTVNITDGNIPGYLAAEWGGPSQSVVNIYGYGFNYDPYSGDMGGGQLSGFWQDGTSFSLDLHYNTYEHLNIIPEPGTILLLGLGGVVLLRRRSG